MPDPECSSTKPTNSKNGSECVLLIGAEAKGAAKMLCELGSTTDPSFHVEWVCELSKGIGRLRNGGVGAVVLDLTLPDSHGGETFDKLFQAAPRVPILILSGSETEQVAREAVQRGAHDYVVNHQADGHLLWEALRAMMDSRAGKAMRLENETAQVTLESIGEAVLRTDVTGHVIYLNRMAEKLTGWCRKEALGLPVAQVFRITDGMSGSTVGDAMGTFREEGKQGKLTGDDYKDCNLVRRDGVEFAIEHTVTSIRSPSGDLAGAVVAFHDNSANRVKTLAMSHFAEHDFLTGLPNRMLFNDRLMQAIALAERQENQLAVMFVDLDQFKRINDSLGHEIGDKLLQSVAKRLVSCVRRTDTVCRLGGDEFLILLSQVEHGADAAVSARKILRMLAAPHLIDNKSIDINVSIGVSTYPNDGIDPESLMNKADTAMYAAKEHGRNNYQFFRRDMQVQLAERQLLERDLRYALGRNEFVLHYQPKVNLQTGQITGLEALVRWDNPQRGLVAPAQFVPIAEECGLILPIGRWVLLEACRQSRKWCDSGLDCVPVAVNVSSAEFEDKDFLSGVRTALIVTGLKASNLQLELTETVLMRDAELAVRTLNTLKAMDVQTAIDDFGIGYSSFTYLRRFPVDMLKIDKSFVQEISEEPDSFAIVGAMLNIGNTLKHRVVAEGIETRVQLEFLQRSGCAEGQGYYFSRPLVAEQAEKFLKAGIREGSANFARA